MNEDLPRELHERLIENPHEGWRMFIEQYTPTLLAVIERSGVRRHDDAMDVYLRVCEHLAADDCARLRRHDASRGPLAAWLTVVVRRVVVDWLRSRKGRRRLFQSVRALSPFDQHVFELRYWHHHEVAAIVELLGSGSHPGTTLPDVFDALERIEGTLSSRQRAELLAMDARAEAPASLEGNAEYADLEPADHADDPERRLQRMQTAERLAAALATLPAEDAVIVSMRFVDGLSTREVERTLHLGPITSQRMRSILDRLRRAFAEAASR